MRAESRTPRIVVRNARDAAFEGKALLGVFGHRPVRGQVYFSVVNLDVYVFYRLFVGVVCIVVGSHCHISVAHH